MGTGTVALAEIRDLTERRHRDPASVLRRVIELMDEAEDPRVEAEGRLAAGLALQEVGRIAEAVDSFRQGVEASVRQRLPDQEALGRAQLAVALLNLGDAAGAEEEIDRARAGAPEPVRGVVQMLFGLILLRTGRVDELLLYLAPTLLGAGREMAALGPFEVLTQGLPFDFHDATQVGTDLRILARNRVVTGAP